MIKIIENQIKKSFEIKAINETIDNIKDYFGEFSRYYLYKFYCEFNNKIVKKHGYLFDKLDFIINEQLYIFSKDIFHLSIRMLIVEMNIMKDAGNLVGETSVERYLYYLDQLKQKEYFNQLIEKYPVLNRLLLLKCKNQIKLIDECLSNFKEDFKSICENFNISNQNKIIQINITSGDSHNGGKKVILLELSNKKILYKPHDFSSEKVFNSIISSINEDERIMFKVNTVKNITRDNYAWQEYVDTKKCTTIQKVKEYYYRIGVYLAMLYSLGCDDIHKENIIASGNIPYLIDMETLSNCQVTILDDNSTLLDHFFYENNQSVLGTMLLPTNSTISIFDYDIGGISGNENIETSKWEAFDIVNEGTDNIQFIKKSKFITDKCDNIARFNDNPTCARDYYKEIVQGFSACYHIFIDNPNKVVDILNRNDVSIRQVLRPTAVYSKFLEASTYPTYLTSEYTFRNLFKKLDNLENLKEHKKAQIEIKSLYEFDIPYFYSDLNTTNIYSGKETLDNYMTSSIIDNIKRKSNRFSESDLKLQTYYINLALSTQHNKLNKSYKYNLFNEIASFKNLNIKDISKKIEKTIEEKLIWDKEKKSCFFLIDMVVKEQRKYSSMDCSLYGAGGVILYYLLLYKSMNNLRYKRIVEGLINGNIELHTKELLENIGVFSGLTSLAYIYYQCYKVLEDEKYFKNTLNILKEVELKVEECTDIDLSTGLAGVIIFLLEIYKKENNKEYLNIADTLAHKLYKLVLNNKFDMLTGLAHGYSGVAWALYSIGHIINNKDFISCAMKCINEENKYYDPTLNNWKDKRNEGAESSYWCYGAFGIGISRLKMYEIAPNNILLNDIETCINIFINYDLESSNYNHSLCHGFTGNLSVIKMFSDFYKDNTKLKVKYEKLLSVLLNDIRHNGIIWGDKELIEDYTFMIGLSGIGYELLRFENANYVNILALEV